MRRFFRKFLIFFLTTIFFSWIYQTPVYSRDNYSQFSDNDLLAIGKTISHGSTLASSLEIDSSKINPQFIEQKAALNVLEKETFSQSRAWAKLAMPNSTTCQVLGPIIDAGFAFWKLSEISKVGTGEISPDQSRWMRNIIPHVVQSWEAIRGPENKNSINTSYINKIEFNGCSQKYTSGITTVQREFHSTAPGVIGKFGYDPAKDSRHTTISNQTRAQEIITPINSPSFIPRFEPLPRFDPPRFDPPPKFEPPRFDPPIRSGRH